MFLLHNTFATDTFEEWVESIFNRCAFEVLVFRLREMYVGRGVYMTAMTRIQAARQEVSEGGKAKVLTVSFFSSGLWHSSTSCPTISLIPP